MKSIRLLLWAALGFALISLTGLGDQWRVMAVAAPDWTRVPDAAPFLAPHEQFFAAIVRGWQYLVTVAADANWISGSEADRLIKQGISLASLCGWCGIVCVCLTLYALMRRPADPRGEEISADGVAANYGGARQPALDLREVTDGLSQAQFSVTNLLLDPAAQPVAEPLRDISDQLQQVSTAIHSTQNSGHAAMVARKWGAAR